MTIVNWQNLIGDLVYAVGPIRQALNTKKDVALLNGAGLTGDIMHRSFPDAEFIDRVQPGDKIINLHAGEAWKACGMTNHISKGFSQLLGVQWCGTNQPDLAWVPKAKNEIPEYVAIAPFSVSGRLDRTLSEVQWQPILEKLKPFGDIYCLSNGVENVGHYKNLKHFTAGSIKELVSFLRRCRLVVSVETGICHISSAANVPTITLWAHGAMMGPLAPTWADNTTFIQLGTPKRTNMERVLRLLDEYLKDVEAGRILKRIWQNPMPVRNEYMPKPLPGRRTLAEILKQQNSKATPPRKTNVPGRPVVNRFFANA